MKTAFFVWHYCIRVFDGEKSGHGGCPLPTIRSQVSSL